MTKPQAHVYLRVSTDAQDVENQLHGVDAYLDALDMPRRKAWRDTASGKTDWRTRAVWDLMNDAQRGDWLVVAEISRLARSTLQILEILKECAERGIIVHAVKSRLIMDGSVQSKIIATVLGLAAEIEREFISARTTEALARRRALGLPMGRPKGRAKTLALDTHAANIDKWRSAGLGKRSIAALCGVSPATLYFWIGRNRPDWIK